MQNYTKLSAAVRELSTVH